MKQTMDLLNLSQPWDCQRFPKSKTICYGGVGGGGGGGSIGNLGKVVEPSFKGLDLTKSTGALSPKGVEKITSTLKAAGDGSAYTNAVNEMNKKIDAELKSSKKGGGLFGSGISISPPKIQLPKSIKDTSLGNAANEVNKLGDGDFSLKKAVQGTASGAESTIKKSDLGKVVTQAADKSGYTGSDIDTGAQKIEKESSNVVNQTLDAVDNPTKVINDAVDRAKNFGAETAGEIQAVGKAYETAGQNIETTGQNIVGAFQDTFQTGMNAASALGQNLANQLGTASGDKGGLKGKANIADLLEQKRKGRRGGLSRSGTSRTLITGKV